MRILVDENIPRITVEHLRSLGHDVLEIRGSILQGADDDVVWHLAQKERALLISTDKQFAARRDSPHYGALVVRLRQPNQEKIHRRVVRAFGEFSETDWPGMTVIMRDRIRQVWRRR